MFLNVGERPPVTVYNAPSRAPEEIFQSRWNVNDA
jgi:hypothetical protein